MQLGHRKYFLSALLDRKNVVLGLTCGMPPFPVPAVIGVGGVSRRGRTHLWFGSRVTSGGGFGCNGP